jgi:hypothetical protein
MIDIRGILSARKWSLTIRILPTVLLIIGLKMAIHLWQLEFITSNPYLSSLVAATVFLIGFLITGVLTDYKESEKLPGELATSIETIADEAQIIYMNKKSMVAKEFLLYLRDFSKSLEEWFYRKIKTKDLMADLRGFNAYYAEFEALTQPAFVSRMKQEQHHIRKAVTRIHTIKDTSFIASGYAIAEGISALLIITLLLTKLDPFLESMFFFVPVVYLLVYMLAMIRDLDDPFEYDVHGEGNEEVSIKEVHDQVKRLDDRIAELDQGYARRELR